MIIEKGVMVMKDGKAWGTIYDEGPYAAYGWVDPDSAPIHNEKYIHQPSDILRERSPYEAEVNTGEIVRVERRTETILLGEKKWQGQKP